MLVQSKLNDTVVYYTGHSTIEVLQAKAHSGLDGQTADPLHCSQTIQRTLPNLLNFWSTVSFMDRFF